MSTEFPSRPPPILDAMSKIQQAVLEELVAVLAAHGYPEVGLPQATLLTCIPADRGMRMGELARLLRVTKGAVTQLVAPLEEAGLLERSRDPDDARGVIVRATPRALRGYRVAFDFTVARYRAWASEVGERRWETFCAVLEKILGFEAGRAAPVATAHRSRAPRGCR
jgi:DNA-binding MarR family transcriptional regulator